MPHSFWPPLPLVGRQVEKANTLAFLLGIPPRIFGASTEIGHLVAERPGAYPVAPVRHPPGSARVRTWVKLGQHFCSLLMSPQDQHTHTHA